MIRFPSPVSFRIYKKCLHSRAISTFQNLFRPKHKILPVRYFWSLKKSPEEAPKNKEEEPMCKTQNDDAKLPDSWSQPKVVIIGAGMAGLSAGHRLVEYGLRDVTILEAADKPGGRIQSCWFADSVVELGASTIHGASVANSVYNLAVSEQILQSPVLRQGPPSGLFYTSRGKAVDTDFSHKIYGLFCQIESMAISMFGKETYPEDSNIESFFSSHIKRELMNFPDSERQHALTVMNGYLASLKEKFGSSLGCVSTKFYGSLPYLPGGDIKIPGGFVGVLTPLIKTIPENSIQYWKPVKSIHWDVNETEKPRASVECDDGELFPADYVIITTSLGFLKDNAHSFFVPKLPDKKMKSIKTLGFGHLSNLFLQFCDPLWLKDEYDIMFAWHPDDYAKSQSWTKGLSSLVINDNSGQVLRGVVTGQEAITMEKLDADQVMTDIQHHMQSFLGNPSIPKPVSILRSRWSSDIYTKGAITYISTQSGLDQIKDLADPIPNPCESYTPTLLFAGEHTCLKHYATVHGARNSGIREANRIIEYTNKFKGAPSVQKT